MTAAHPGKRVLPYFQDEARFGQKGVLARVWARTNSRPTAVKQTQYDYLYVFGAVCPETGESFGLVAPRVDTVVMNRFLELFGASLAADAHALMVLDNAGWHHCKDLVVPSNVTLLFLPPRAPELNPIEPLWLWLKGHLLSEPGLRRFRRDGRRDRGGVEGDGRGAGPGQFGLPRAVPRARG